MADAARASLSRALKTATLVGRRGTWRSPTVEPIRSLVFQDKPCQPGSIMSQHRASIRLRVHSENTVPGMPGLLSLPGDLRVNIGHDFKAEWEGGHCFKFSLGPFASKGDAEREGSRLSTALLWACASLDIAGRVDELRIEPVPEGIEITGAASAVIGWSGEVFQDELAAACDAPPPNPELAMSLALFNRAELESTPDLRFVTLVMALEVLAKPEPAQEQVIAAVARWQSEAAQMKDDIGESMSQSLCSRLKYLKEESISQALQRYTRQVLGANYVAAPNLTVKELVRDAYQARSDIVHRGRTCENVHTLSAEIKRLLRATYSSHYGRPFKKA